MRNTEWLSLPWLHSSFRKDLTRILPFLLTLAFIELVVCLLPSWPNKYGIPYYLPFHSLLETVSIVISMMVFVVGWNTRREQISGNIVLLSCVFFFVGVVDFSHTASYYGMPDFISPNDPEKNIIFWLLARLLAGLALVTISIRDWKPLKSTSGRNQIFAALAVSVVVFHWFAIAHENWFPATFVQDVGLTDFKKGVEYLIIAINLIAAVIFLFRMTKPQPFNLVLLFEAACVMAMSEYFFTLYTTTRGTYNVMGHLYKVIAYFLIYRAIVVQVIEEPYKNLQKAEELLLQINSQLEERVTARTKDLNEANATLDKAFTELQRVQAELVQREKIASLGTLIAGVSHEMNTPIGNSLLASSSLRDEVVAFDAEVDTGKVSRSRLREFNAHLKGGLDLILRNLQRAIEQLTRFKQVSADQVSELPRRFNLGSVIADNLSLLQPRFKNTPHQVLVDIDAGIEMDSYPGAIGQVIGDLVINALVHGFSADMHGVIMISARKVDAKNLELVIADNGAGIAPENLERVFDPFFTTRMGQGGNGLGLSMVFKIVNSTLGGTIHVTSEPGRSTTFTIHMPLVK